MSKSYRIHILVVDDEEDVRTIFEFNFEDEIHEGSVKMSFADSGLSCLNFLKTDDAADIILILSDINMPNMDGLELLEKVKADYNHIVVYMVSAYDTDDFKNKASDLGARHFVSKPVDFDELKKTIFTEFNLKDLIAS